MIVASHIVSEVLPKEKLKEGRSKGRNNDVSDRDELDKK